MATQIGDDEVQFELDDQTITVKTDEIVHGTGTGHEYYKLLDINEPYLQFIEVNQTTHGNWEPISGKQRDTFEIWEAAFNKGNMEKL